MAGHLTVKVRVTFPWWGKAALLAVVLVMRVARLFRIPLDADRLMSVVAESVGRHLRTEPAT